MSINTRNLISARMREYLLSHQLLGDLCIQNVENVAITNSSTDYLLSALKS